MSLLIGFTQLSHPLLWTSQWDVHTSSEYSVGRISRSLTMWWDDQFVKYSSRCREILHIPIPTKKLQLVVLIYQWELHRYIFITKGGVYFLQQLLCLYIPLTLARISQDQISIRDWLPDPEVTGWKILLPSAGFEVWPSWGRLKASMTLLTL